MRYLLSFPRSGSHWTCYCLEVLTRVPHNAGRFIGLLPLSENYRILRTHALTQEDASIGTVPSCQLQQDDYLCILLRDYKEHMFHVRAPQNPLETYKGWLNKYESHPGPKKIIYYEDLISSEIISSEIPALVDFYDLPWSESWSSFYSQLDFHRDRCLNSAGGREKPSKGRSPRYHVLLKKITIEQEIKADKMAKKILGKVWKHVKRYSCSPDSALWTELIKKLEYTEF